MTEERLFPFLLAAMSIGIILAVTIIVITPREDEPFSSVQFTDPEGLPNIVRVNSQQDVSYDVVSFEHDNTTYNITSTLELFRLYDTTEGLYSCLSPYRKKFFLGWSNQSNASFIPTPQQGLVHDLVIKPDVDLLNWSQINLYFTLGQTFGEGDFVVYFGERNKTPSFTIRINTQENKIYFNEKYQAFINVSSQNDRARIFLGDNVIKFYYQNELLFEEDYELVPGQFGFESRNGLFSLTNMITSKLHPIEIPDRGNVINYDVDTELFYNELFRVRKELSRTYNFIRQYLELPPPLGTSDTCATFACTYTQPDTQDIIDVHYDNVTALVTNLPWNELSFPFWHVAREEVHVPWSSFNLTGERPELPNDASISVLFNDNLALIVTNQTISLAYHDVGGIYIKKYPFNGTTFSMQVEKHTIYISTNDGIIPIDVTYDFFNATMRLFTMNSLQTVSIVNLKKTDCEPYTFCDVNIIPSAPRRFEQEEILKNYGEVKRFIPEPATPDYFDPNIIPSSTSSFNGPQAQITNSTNFTFSMRAIYLDGKGLVSILFKDLNDTPLFNVTHNLIKNTISVDDTTIHIRAMPKQWRRIGVEYTDNLTIYLNKTVVYSRRNQGPLTGYFSIETEDSHLELVDMYLKKDLSTLRLPRLEDPCRLRLVHKEVVRDETFTLPPQTTKSFSDSYTLEKFFDYGKVSVVLDGSSHTNNTPLEIHHWLVRE